MNIIFFAHPSFLNSQSMVRFASMLSVGMEERGHTVQTWSPKARFFNLPLPAFLKKWMGYIDQYIVFKFEVKKLLKQCPKDTLFVFTDQALGPWVPWINNRPHFIHCHDFLAQRSALGQIPENPTKWFGIQYQAYIRNGYQKGKNFISVSKKTETDLHEFLVSAPNISKVIYNGLNELFSPGDSTSARVVLGKQTNLELGSGYILHIGGNQWYKNRPGVIEAYNGYRELADNSIPLLLIGHEPTLTLLEAFQRSDFKTDIHFLSDIKDDLLKVAYNGATAFIFPSLAEGFGWPIAEAMASGCPVITTDQAPMTEVAGDAAYLIHKMPADEKKRNLWAMEVGRILNIITIMPADEKEKVIQIGIKNSQRFNLETALNEIEKTYRLI